MERTASEQAYLRTIQQRIEGLKTLLNERDTPPLDASSQDWFDYLLAMKQLSGNASNAMTVVASLLAKEYLNRKLQMRPYDAAEKPPGASGLDIDERTVDGLRVVGEIKTTTPHLGTRLGAAQETTFRKDFAKLNEVEASYKFFFLTDADAFEYVKRRYATQLPGVIIVLLTTGEDFTAS